jgi:hypothetical protein
MGQTGPNRPARLTWCFAPIWLTVKFLKARNSGAPPYMSGPQWLAGGGTARSGSGCTATTTTPVWILENTPAWKPVFDRWGVGARVHNRIEVYIEYDTASTSAAACALPSPPNALN